MMLLYGEDAFTFAMLGPDLGLFLRALKDPTDPRKATVFIRPSFRRRGTKEGDLPRAAFGEYDAIVITPAAIYLVEAKWSRSGAIRGHLIVLDPVQVKRHAVMRAYIDAWRLAKAKDWKDLDTKPLNDKLCALNCCVPRARSLLATNLRIVLNSITNKTDGPVRGACRHH